MKMLNDNVLIEETQDNLTMGGIALPETRDKEFSTGIVKAVGPGVMLEIGEFAPCTVIEGDRVKFITRKAYDIDVHGTTYKVTNESCIVVIL